jgi:hypothetical protein
MDNDPNNISSNYSTGNKSYWKCINLDRSNKLYAKLMNGKKYEDDPRAN